MFLALCFSICSFKIGAGVSHLCKTTINFMYPSCVRKSSTSSSVVYRQLFLWLFLRMREKQKSCAQARLEQWCVRPVHRREWAGKFAETNSIAESRSKVPSRSEHSSLSRAFSVFSAPIWQNSPGASHSRTSSSQVLNKLKVVVNRRH